MADQKPKDRNQAVKQQLLKKRTEVADKKIPLAPGEMVDDALARGTAAAGKWVQKNFGAVQWVIVAAVLGGAAYGVYDWRMGKRADAASSELIKGVADERGRISESPTPKQDDDDPTPVFKSLEERRDAALGAYRGVQSKYPGTGAAILARLGEAGSLLDKHDWDGAAAAYRDVKASPLAGADADVRGRSLEGIGFALEGKGDVDGALKAFRELENTDVRGFKELGMYHQARLLLGKGDKDKAKELLKSARERLHAPTVETHPFSFLEGQVDDLLRRIDPSAVPDKGPAPTLGSKAGGPPGQQMDPEQLQRLQEQIQRRMREAQEKAQKDLGGPAPAGSK